MSRSTLLRRLRNVLLQLLAAWLILTVCPVLVLRWIDPPLTLFMIADRWDAVLDDEPGYTFRHEWIEYGAIAPVMKVAVIAAEDQRFAEHSGFDLVEIGNALTDRFSGKSARGASTISQQTAKNLFLWRGQSWVRKAMEAWLTLWIEWLWPKSRILEVYLNVAEFGQGTFGVETASQRYFRKSAKRLSEPEAALLAAVLPNPIVYRVEAPGTRVIKRQQWIRRQIRSIGDTAYLERLD